MSKRLLLFPLLVWMFSGCGSAPRRQCLSAGGASPEVLASSDARFPVIAAADRGAGVAIAWQARSAVPCSPDALGGTWTTPAPVSPAGR